MDELWDKPERAAWAPPQHMKPSEWAERHRVLGRGQTDIPGMWRNANTPYLRGVMDLCVAPGVVQVNLMKAGQIGVSEASRNLIGYWAHLDPDPCGLALPNALKGRKIVSNRIMPMLEDTPCLRALKTSNSRDIQLSQIKLINGFLLHLMWAGSPSSTSADPMRRVINDEVDKPGFSGWGGGEPDAIGRTQTRLRTYGDRRLQLNISTPTTRHGVILRLFDGSAYRLYFMVPCPFCSKYQRLIFRQVRWKRIELTDRVQRAARLMADDAVWYECIHCGEHITPAQKAVMVRAGRWGTLDGDIEDAETVDEWPRGTTIGMHVSALYCLWEKWSDIAAMFIKAAGDPVKTFSFRTETLGEPWEDQMEKTRPSLYSEKCGRAEHAEGIVPEWAVRLIVAIDTQHDHFYAVVRAWGAGMISQRIWHGRLETFKELDDLCFRHPWPCAGDDRAAMRSDLVLIDSGGTRLEGDAASRTMQVYRWALKRRARVRPIKGASQPKAGIFIWPSKGWLDTGSRSRGKHRDRAAVRIWFLDTNHFQDLLAEMVSRGTSAVKKDDDEVWHLNKRNDEEYNWHMANMHKIVMQSRKGMCERWVPVEDGAPEHYRDCEVYQVMGAYMARVHELPSQEKWQLHQNAVAEERRQRTRQGSRKKRGDAWTVKALDVDKYL